MVVGQDDPFEDEDPLIMPLSLRPADIVTKLTSSPAYTIDEALLALYSLKQAGAPGDTPLGQDIKAQELVRTARAKKSQQGRSLSDDEHNALKRHSLVFWVEFKK